jgi:IS5 family transposase
LIEAATIIAAPFSTKSRQGSRDSVMQQTKKGNPWTFDTKEPRPTMHPLQHGMIVAIVFSRSCYPHVAGVLCWDATVSLRETLAVAQV